MSRNCQRRWTLYDINQTPFFLITSNARDCCLCFTCIFLVSCCVGRAVEHAVLQQDHSTRLPLAKESLGLHLPCCPQRRQNYQRHPWIFCQVSVQGWKRMKAMNYLQTSDLSMHNSISDAKWCKMLSCCLRIFFNNTVAYLLFCGYWHQWVPNNRILNIAENL